MKKALIAMSGGVDSSVAAVLTEKKGYTCIGATMKLYDGNGKQDSDGETRGEKKDAEDAKRIADSLGIDFYLLDFQEEFRKNVIERFITAYENGDTPNPCVDCNRFMKFGYLHEEAEKLGCDKVVTGHYARVEYDKDRKRWLLRKAKNIRKDQSYVLYSLTQEQLSRSYFPLGEYESKEEVRQIAAELGFINAEKKESQDICFVPDGDYGTFMEQYTGKSYEPGEFVDEEGNVLGTHKGIIRYTIGQRKGLGLSLKSPMYVCRKCMEDNQVVLTSEDKLFTTELKAKDFNWIMYDTPQEPVKVTAKPRYRAKEAEATAKVNEDGTVQIIFDEPQRAITKGQAVVLYDGEYVVGGGTIC